jgi:hypothetical protein
MKPKKMTAELKRQLLIAAIHELTHTLLSSNDDPKLIIQGEIPDDSELPFTITITVDEVNK